MATPSFLRELSPRFRSLGSPVVWAPLTIFVFLGIFAWEYSQNPDWFNREKPAIANSNTDLTEEEQARLAEVDTVDLLLEQAELANSLSTGVNIIGPSDPEQDNWQTETIPSADDRQLAGREEPFASYAAEYAFPSTANGTNASPLTPTTPPAEASIYGGGPAGRAGDRSPSRFSNGRTNQTAPATSSALSEALSRQQSQKDAAASRPSNNAQPASSADRSESQSQSPTTSPATNPATGSVTGGSDTLPARQPNAQSGAPSASQPASQPASQAPFQLAPATGNISSPYSRTTPSMSPPAGTTGYQPPATTRLPIFNQPPQQPTRNPFSPAPSSSSTPPQPQTNPQTNTTTLYTAPTSVQPAQNPRR